MTTGLLHQADSRLSFNIDPRTKLLLMFIVNITIFGAKNVYLMILMTGIPIILLWNSRQKKRAILCACSYAAAAAANELLVPATHGALNVIVVMISGMVYRMMPGLIMGYYLVMTTTVSEFIASMERLHVSQKIIIPLSVMFRFFPTIAEEAQSINDAMRMRGLSLGSRKFFQNPLNFVEYRLIPLMISTVKIGDELSAAALTRGLGSPVRRTNICKIGFSAIDVVLAAISGAAFIFFMIARH